MKDLVRRMRDVGRDPGTHQQSYMGDLLVEAADAIERLSAPAEPMGYITRNGLKMLTQDDATVMLRRHEYLIRPDAIPVYLHPAVPASARDTLVLKESDGWITEYEGESQKITCHSRVIGGVLCRWWGDGPVPAGVDMLDRAAAPAPDANEVRKWLDENTTFYNTAESSAPVLASVSKRIWYHATNDTESYPFSAAIDAAIKEQK